MAKSQNDVMTSDELAAYADDHEDMAEWLGGRFDPYALDLEEANAILAKWRKD
jgi:hypothetical protein